MISAIEHAHHEKKGEFLNLAIHRDAISDSFKKALTDAIGQAVKTCEALDKKNHKIIKNEIDRVVHDVVINGKYTIKPHGADIEKAEPHLRKHIPI